MSEKNSEYTINFVLLSKDLWRNRVAIVKVAAIFFVMSILYASSLDDVYQVKVVLSLNDDKSQVSLSSISRQFSGLAGLVGMEGAGKSDLSIRAVATLKSRKFITDLIREKNIKQHLFSSRWDDSSNTWKKPGMVAKILRFFTRVDNKQTQKDLEPSDEGAYRRFLKNNFQLVEDRKSGLVTLTISANDPNLAFEWSKLLVERINGHFKKSDREEAEKNIVYLKKEIETTKVVEIQSVLYNLIQNETQKIMLTNSREHYAFRPIDPPYLPEQKSYPNRKITVAGGTLLGIILGLFYFSIVHIVKTMDH